MSEQNAVSLIGHDSPPASIQLYSLSLEPSLSTSIPVVHHLTSPAFIRLTLLPDDSVVDGPGVPVSSTSMSSSIRLLALFTELMGYSRTKLGSTSLAGGCSVEQRYGVYSDKSESFSLSLPESTHQDMDHPARDKHALSILVPSQVA